MAARHSKAWKKTILKFVVIYEKGVKLIINRNGFLKQKFFMGQNILVAKCVS